MLKFSVSTVTVLLFCELLINNINNNIININNNNKSNKWIFKVPKTLKNLVVKNLQGSKVGNTNSWKDYEIGEFLNLLKIGEKG